MIHLVDVFDNPLSVGDTILTVKEARRNHWYVTDLCIRKYIISEIIFCSPNLTNRHYYFTWRSKPFLNRHGKEITVGGRSKKYKPLRYIQKHGAKSPWIYKVC